ncbi:hypothetical protein BN906_00017 [Clostridium tetani 12124569]|nr:hypothetical protein BN906_00017 [Clostridium tetani 12124569]
MLSMEEDQVKFKLLQRGYFILIIIIVDYMLK